MFRIILIFISFLFFLSLKGQIPGGLLDPLSYWQLTIESLAEEEGAKIELKNKDGAPFLRMGSMHEQSDLFDPFLSRAEESNLQFVLEDPEAKVITHQMTLMQDGNLQVHKYSGTSTRNLVVRDDGTIRPQEFSGSAGVLSINAHDFVSYANPGDDHNFHEIYQTIHHEAVFGTEVLIAPIHLPQKAIIKEIRVHYIHLDNPDDSLAIYLVARSQQLLPGGYPVNDQKFLIGHTTPHPACCAPSQYMELSTSIEIDNMNNFYFLEALNPNDIQRWPTDDVGIRSARIIYDLSEN